MFRFILWIILFFIIWKILDTVFINFMRGYHGDRPHDPKPTKPAGSNTNPPMTPPNDIHDAEFYDVDDRKDKP